MKSFSFAAFPFVCVLMTTPAFAEPPSAGIRYVTIVQSTIDDKATSDATAEHGLMNALVEAGATVIKPNPMLGARLVAQELLKGTISDEITALDAEVLIAATVNARPDQDGTLFNDKRGLKRYRSSLKAVLIAIDTQEVLETFSIEDFGVETDQRRAIQVAFERAGASLGKKIIGSSNRIARRVEILVEGLPATAGERLKDALLSLPGAKAAKVVYAASDKSKAILFLDGSAATATELAIAIDRLPDAGLIVNGLSERTIHARYSMTRAVRIPVAFARFSGKARGRGAEISTYIRDALLAQGSLTPAGSGPIDLASIPAERERQLARLGLLEQDALILSGRYVERPKHVEISAEIHSTRPGGELLIRDHGLCPKDQLMTCSTEIGIRLLKDLPAALVDRRTVGTPPANETVAIKGIHIDPELFPARGGAYRTKGIGHLVAENRSMVPATGGLLRVFLPQLMAEPVMIEAPELAAQSTAQIPITFGVRSDPEANGNGKLSLALEYTVAGRRERIDRLVDVPVLEKYALDWREPDSIAAFVTERTPAINDLANQAIKAIPAGDLKEPFARPAALFYAMSPLNYQRDAVHGGRPDEIDDVKMPIETLTRGYGDCEDLAVLYVSLAESIGTRTALVLTPGHVLAAVDSEIPAQSAALILDPSRFIVHKGRAYIPVETTRVGSSFSEAWKDGAKVITRAKEEGLEVRVIDVRDAHALFPAVAFKVQVGPTRAPTSWVRLADELRKLASERAASMEQALREPPGVQEYSVEKASRRAMLLVASGRAPEAKRLLEETSVRFHESVALANNLANIHLASDAAVEAIAFYDRALAKSTDAKTQVRVHLNAAIAARVKRDAELSHAHAARALAKATTPELRTIVTDFLAGLGDGGIVPGVDSGSFDRVVFAGRLRQALETHESMLRGNAAPSVRVSAADLVYWLDSEVQK